MSLLLAPWISSHAYEMTPGLRCNAFKYLAGQGVPHSSAGAQLCALGVIATQYLASICWPNGQTVVAGCPSIHVEDSARGKSALFKATTQGLQDYIDTMDLPQPDGEEASSSPILVTEDATREVLLDEMSGTESLTLLTTEGAIALPLLRSAAHTLIKLVDAEGLKHARRTDGIRIAISREKRFSFHIFTQPGVFISHAEYLRSAQAEGGLQNRCMFTYTPSTWVANAVSRVDAQAPALTACLVRAMERVNTAVKQIRTRAVRPRIRLSRDAVDYLNQIDADARSAAQQYPTYLRNYLCRHAERTLREAGSHHIFEHGIEGDIELPTLWMADRYSRESFNAFSALTHVPRVATKQEQQTSAAEAFIRYHATYFGLQLSMTKLRSTVANSGLTKAQFAAAIPKLCEQGKVYVDGDALHVAPQLLGLWPRASM